jgi:hypothetical protein
VAATHLHAPLTSEANDVRCDSKVEESIKNE